ncbi:MAG: hypothetical protein J2P35_23070, partial [Actinobacteria bacterium]|nr:hypothetical protein [Actinomycetota bacterium]
MTDTSIRKNTGASGLQGARTLTRPLLTVTSSASMTMPGLVTSVSSAFGGRYRHRARGTGAACPRRHQCIRNC